MKVRLIFNFNKTQVSIIKKSQFWMVHCIDIKLSGLIDIAKKINEVGGFMSNNKDPCNFLCIFLRFVELSPSIDIIKGFLLEDRYVALRVLALIYIRLILSKKNILTFYKPFINSEQLVTIKIGKFTVKSLTLKVLIKNLIKKKYFYGFYLPFIKM
uniref:Pre-mRNA-splicing factor 38 n=1 Tax=Lotharella vacuolata TaxID=74820 RepID=A0A0H5BQT4_9EUKA|nr:mRNA splicing factor PRP38 [Lotharella vacuolata]